MHQSEPEVHWRIESPIQIDGIICRMLSIFKADSDPEYPVYEWRRLRSPTVEPVWFVLRFWQVFRPLHSEADLVSTETCEISYSEVRIVFLAHDQFYVPVRVALLRLVRIANDYPNQEAEKVRFAELLSVFTYRMNLRYRFGHLLPIPDLNRHL